MSSALSAVTIATGLVAGCSSDSSVTETLPEAGSLLQQSSQTAKALDSAHVFITVNGKIDGLPLKQLAGDLTNVPATAVSGTATIVMGGSDLDAKLVVADGNLFAALSGDNWLDMGPAVDVYDPSTILNPNTGVANMLNSFSDAKSEAGEKIDDIETVKVSGNVSADAVNKLIPRLKASAPMPGTAWIEKDGDRQLVRARLEPSSGNSIEMTLSEWNKPVTVTKPQV